MTIFKYHTQQYLSLFSGILLMAFLLLNVSDVLFQTGVFMKENSTVVELCKDGEKEPAGETTEKEFSEDGTDWYTQKPVSFCFGYINEMTTRLETAPAMTQGVDEIHLPPPKLILI